MIPAGDGGIAAMSCGTGLVDVQGRRANPPPRPRLDHPMWVGSFGWPRTPFRLFYPGLKTGEDAVA